MRVFSGQSPMYPMAFALQCTAIDRFLTANSAIDFGSVLSPENRIGEKTAATKRGVNWIRLVQPAQLPNGADCSRC